MSFSIVIQQNTSEPERVDKALTDLLTLTGTLREQTSIIDPHFRVAASEAQLVGCNYVTVPSFGRSYFVRDIVSVRNGILELVCHTDVLSSWKVQLRANSAIIHKQENIWNLYLNDGSLQAYQKPKVLTKAFPHGFTTMQYILTVAGG